MNSETPVATGRDADVYAIDDDRVLRRYRAGGDVAAEAAIMTYLAGHGFPVPTVFHAAGTDMVLQRVSGPSMLTALRDNGIDAASAAATLADLHHRLHRIPAQESTDPAIRVLHLDLHPDNVLLGPDGPVLIDWRNSREGPPDLDTAMSALILATAAVGELPELAEPAHALLPAFLHSVDGAPLARLDGAVAMRSGDPNLTEREVADLARAANLIRDIIADR